MCLATPATAETVLWGSSSGGGDPGSLFRIRTTTGEAELVGPSGLGESISAVAVDPQTGTLYGILGSACTGAALVTIDQNSGVATLVGKIRGQGFLNQKASGKKKGKHGSATHNNGKYKHPNGTASGACDGGADALTFAADG